MPRNKRTSRATARWMRTALQSRRSSDRARCKRTARVDQEGAADGVYCQRKKALKSGASLIVESGRLAQANSDAAQSLQLGAEESRPEGDEEIAKKDGAGDRIGKTETNSNAMPRIKSQSKWICETGQLGSEQQAGPAATGA
ncbi:uncharacterized protein [Dermacentor albipictus]|uniref:uncharacterized protein n=1 Tax=Dermacentor albipictus TaxID=60249 RepID=UPI0038FC637D